MSVRWDEDAETIALYALAHAQVVEGGLLPQGLALALEMHRMDGLVIERLDEKERGVILFRARKPRAHERGGFDKAMPAGSYLLKPDVTPLLTKASLRAKKQ